MFFFVFLIFFLFHQTNCFSTEGFSFKRDIRIVKRWNQKQNLTNEDVLLELNTKELVENGKIRENCIDLIFLEKESKNRIEHYIENGCNLINSRIYLSLNFSKNNVSETEKFVEMYYRHPRMNESLGLEFEGSFFKFTEAENCPDDWKKASNFDEKFIYVDSSNAGQASEGSSQHSHFVYGETATSSLCKEHWLYNVHPKSVITDHTHSLATESSEVEKKETTPPYKKTLVCQNSMNTVTGGLIELFKNKSLPLGIEEYLGFQDRFPVGSLKSRETGGTLFHNHTFEGESQFPNGVEALALSPGIWSDSDTEADLPKYHIHKFKGVTEPASNLPSYFNVIFGLVTNNYLNQSTNSNSPLLMTDKLPPLGFKVRVSSDGFYIHSSSTFTSIDETFGNGGTPHSNHEHAFSTKLENTNEGLISVYGHWSSGTDITCGEEHFHTISATTFSSNNEIPHISVMLITRKEIKTDFEIGEEQKIAELENYITLCKTECLNGGSCVYNTSKNAYNCKCKENYFSDDCSQTTLNFFNNPDYLIPLIIIIVVAISVVIVLVLFVLLISIAIGCIIQKRKKDEKVNDIITNLVHNVDKEEQLKEERIKIENERIELQEQQKKLEKQKKEDDEERKQLKESLMLLKEEKQRLEKQAVNSMLKRKLSVILKSEEEITEKRLLLKTNKYGYGTYRGLYQQKKIMFRVFKKGIFEDVKHFFNPVKQFEYEVNEYAQYKHPNILEYLAITKSPIGLVSEFCKNGTLYTYFNGKKRKLTFFQKVRIIYEIAEAIQYLHKKGVCHGNISSKTIFLSEDLRPKIDSGFCKTFDKELVYSQYCAPELINPSILTKEEEENEEDDLSPEDSLELKSDIFALGMLMMEVVAQNFNLYKIDPKKRIKIGEKVANDQNYRPDLGRKIKYYPNWFINLVKMCWKSPNDRPSISRIKMIIETIVNNEND